MMKKKDPKAPKGRGAVPPAPPAGADNDKAAQRRVALLRHKLTKAMDDPLMRDQIVRAIRTMMTEGK